jgi:hypothetical protein
MNEFIARNGIISRGNLTVSGSLVTTQPTTFSGSLSLAGDLNFQPGTTGASRYISMSASPTTASGNNIVIQAGAATAAGTGGSVSIQPGGGAGGPGAGTVTISNTTWWNGATINGTLTVTNQGPNTGTSLNVTGGGQTAMRFDWDNINLVTSAVSANRILRFTGASQYQVRGSGTTFSTTAFQVQNANASSSLSVRDDGLVTVGASIGLPGSAYVYWGDFNSSIQHTGAATNFRTYQDNQPWSFITANNSSVQAKIDTGYVRVKTGFSAVGNSPVTMSGWDGGGGTAGNILLVKGGNSGVGTSYAGGNGSDLILENGLATDNSLGFGGTPGSIIFKYGVYNNTASVEYGRLNSSGNFLIGTTAGSAKLLISGSSNSTLFEIDSPAVNNILYVSGSGNVGIGTGTPTYTLDVSGSARIQTAAAGVPNLLHISNLQTDGGPGTAIALYTGGNVSNASRIVALRSGTSGQSDIGLETTGVTRLFVAANSGNVGIGTTSPSAQLQVKGSGTTVSTTSLLVQNANNRTSFTVSDDGRVGINVSPYDIYALAVDPISGSTGVYVAQRAVANNINEYRFINSSGTPSAGSTAGRITWHTLSYLEGIYSSAVIDGYRAIDLRILGWSGSNAETARFTYDNKVGIGTTSPSAKLHVYTGNSGGVPLIIDGSNSSDGTIAKFGRGIGGAEKNFYISSTNNQYINLGTEGDFKFKVGVTADQPYATGVSAMVITASGSVGVGTTSPSARMHILGSGATSSTTSLLIQNANASASLTVTDDRLVTVSSRLQVGTFTPSTATGSSTIFTTGRISAGGGITVYGPNANDDNNTGIFHNSGLQIYSQNATVALFRPVGGGSSGFMFNVGGYGYNAPSGTGTVNTVLIDNLIAPTGINSVNYNYVTVAPSITQGSFGTGTIRGFYFAPGISSLNTSPLRAFESTRGDVIIGGNANVTITGSLSITGSVAITGSLLMPSGSNTRVGSDVLTAGSVLINNTTVTANSLIFVTPTAAGTLTGTLRITAIVPSTSFTVSSTSNTDTAAFSYFIVN